MQTSRALLVKVWPTESERWTHKYDPVEIAKIIIKTRERKKCGTCKNSVWEGSGHTHLRFDVTVKDFAVVCVWSRDTSGWTNRCSTNANASKSWWYHEKVSDKRSNEDSGNISRPVPQETAGRAAPECGQTGHHRRSTQLRCKRRPFLTTRKG